MQIEQFSVAGASFVYTALPAAWSFACCAPVQPVLVQSLEGRTRPVSFWCNRQAKVFTLLRSFTCGEILHGRRWNRRPCFFFALSLFGLVSDGSLNKHPQPLLSLLCFHGTRWDFGRIWRKTRIKNFGCTKLLLVGNSRSIFQWEGPHCVCYAGGLPFIRHLRGIFWSLFFFFEK